MAPHSKHHCCRSLKQPLFVLPALSFGRSTGISPLRGHEIFFLPPKPAALTGCHGVHLPAPGLLFVSMHLLAPDLMVQLPLELATKKARTSSSECKAVEHQGLSCWLKQEPLRIANPDSQSNRSVAQSLGSGTTWNLCEQCC